MRKSNSYLLITISLSISIFSQLAIANVTDTSEGKGKEKRGLARITSFFVRPKKAPAQRTPEPRPESEVPISPRPPLVIRKPLCTWVMPRTVKIGGFLGTCEGDVVTLMDAENVPEDQIVACNSCSNCGEPGRQGRLLISALELNQHVGNVYLEIADFLVENPLLLAALIESINSEECDENRMQLLERLVEVLAARRVLGPALEGLFSLELESTSQVNELFRNDNTPGVTLVRAILRRKGRLNEFRCSLAKNMETASQDFLKYGDIHAIIEILKSCQQTLMRCPEESIPRELPLVLGALKKSLVKFIGTTTARERGLREEHVPILLGSLLYLRLLSPTISQPRLYLEHVSEDAAKAMVIIGQAMQFVGNRVDPAEDKPLYAIATQLRALYNGTTAIVNRIIAAPFHLFDVDRGQVLNAATLYQRTAVTAQELVNHGGLEQEEFERLKVRLGIVPRLEMLCDEDVPRIDEIRDIQDMLRKLLHKRFPF